MNIFARIQENAEIYHARLREEGRAEGHAAGRAEERAIWHTERSQLLNRIAELEAMHA